MNLEKLRFKNINSFVGEFEIDFEKFKNELFLISGPTGSGKTTIIDAILAALYDKTPRLNYSKNLLNEDSNEAKIYLSFFVGDDKYEINWSVKRKKDGEINNVKRTLYKNEKLIADKKSEIQKEILKAIKLDFSEFTKAIVLAQGEFDAFLSAGDKEKADVLERILNVKEYELISKRIYQKTQEVKNKIEELAKKIEDIGEINEIESKEKELKSFQDSSIKLYEKQKEIENLIQRQKQKEKLKNDIQKLESEIREIDEKNDLIYKQLKTLEFEKKEKEFLEYKKRFNDELKRLDGVVEMVVMYESLQEKLNELKNKQKTLKKREEELNKLLKDKEKELKENEEKIKSIQIIQDERLENFDEIVEVYGELRSLRKSYATKKEEKNKIYKLLEDLKKKLEAKLTEKKSLESKLEYLKAKVLVLEYEEARKELKDNEECPLCGSKIHPYVKNPPNIKEETKIEYENTKNALLKVEESIKTLENEKLKLEAVFKKIEDELNEIVKEGEEISGKFKKYNITEDEIEKLKQIKEQNEKNQKILQELKDNLTKIASNISNIKLELTLINKEKEKLQTEIKNTSSEIEKITKTPGFDIQAKEKKEKLQSEFMDKEKEFELINKKYVSLNNELSSLKRVLETLHRKRIDLSNEYNKIEEVKIDEDIDELKAKIKETNIKIGQITKELEHLKAKEKEKNILLKTLDSYQKEFKTLEIMNKAIGSANGDKFKRIAINYLMSTLLDIANYHLERITNGRYLFEKSEDVERLNLYIIDRFYENKKRDVATLSGGEKFLASLSLSFGLSDMVRDKVDIEVMFLDEGFGTLDNESLYNALNILKEASLGKSVGIISHVDSLKEEITKQIKVKKLPNGRSRVEISV